ncbi:MAG: Sec-independent protein translocase protein TatB [Oligoflexales bacterium]
MFGIGFMELCLIAVVALVFVGPTKLPELMKQVSRVFVQMRQMSTEVRGTVNQALADAERELQTEQATKQIQDILSAPLGTESQEDSITDVQTTDIHSEENKNSSEPAPSTTKSF